MQSFRNLGKLIWFLGSSLKKGRHLPNRQRKSWKRVKAHLVLNHLDPEGPGITYVCIFFMRITHMAILGYQGNLKVQSLTGQSLSNFNSYPERRVQMVDRHFCHSPLSERKWKLPSRVHSLWPHGLYSPWNSPGQNTSVGSLSLLQGIFPDQRSNPGLLPCKCILYQLSHKGSPLNKSMQSLW